LDAVPDAPWMIHQMEKMAILPTFDSAPNGPVLVHVLGSHWNGPKNTKDRHEQAEFDKSQNSYPFSQTFEIIKNTEKKWKINRVILMVHHDLTKWFADRNLTVGTVDV